MVPAGLSGAARFDQCLTPVRRRHRDERARFGLGRTGDARFTKRVQFGSRGSEPAEIGRIDERRRTISIIAHRFVSVYPPISRPITRAHTPTRNPPRRHRFSPMDRAERRRAVLRRRTWVGGQDSAARRRARTSCGRREPPPRRLAHSGLEQRLGQTGVTSVPRR